MVSGRHQRGVALLTVLWVVGLLTVLVSGYSFLVRTENQLARNQVRALQAQLLAEAGVAEALYQLTVVPEPRRWRVDGRPYPLPFGHGAVTVQMRDASGLVNLNLAPPALLAALLEQPDVAFEERERIVDLILDWRDSDELVRLKGGERRDYRAAGLDYGPKNGPFERIDELEWIPGMSAATLARLRPHLTLYSGQNGVDPAAASAALLRQLSHGDTALVEEIMGARDQGVFSYTQLRERVDWPIAGSTGVVHIYARAESDGGAVAALEVVVKTTATGRGYDVLSWQPGSIQEAPTSE